MRLPPAGELFCRRCLLRPYNLNSEAGGYKLWMHQEGTTGDRKLTQGRELLPPRKGVRSGQSPVHTEP
jgi:hypothetical protein